MDFTVSKKIGSEDILIGKKTSVELIDKLDDFETKIIGSSSFFSIVQSTKISSIIKQDHFC